MKILLATLWATSLLATTYTSTGNGNWNNAATWGGLGPPTTGDTANVLNTVTATAPVTVGTVNIVAAGKVIVAGVSFHYTAAASWNATSSANTCAFTLNAGSTLTMDANFVLPVSGYAYSPICAAGNSGSHVTVDGGSGHSYIQFTGTYGGGITATYTDFVNIGDATHFMTAVWTSPSFTTGNDWNVTHSTFSGCGIITGVNGQPDGSSWIHNNNVHSGTLGIAVMEPKMPSALTSGTRSIQNNVFDLAVGNDTTPGNWGLIQDFTIAHNYFGGGFQAAGVAASWSDNFHRTSIEEGANHVLGGLSTQSQCLGSYLVIDDANSRHTHGIDLVSTAPVPSTMSVSGCVLDATFTSSTLNANDGLVNENNGVAISFGHNLSLVGADGYGVGDLTDQVSYSTSTIAADHNTLAASPWGAFDYENESPPGPFNNLGTITNNIVFSTIVPGTQFLPITFQSHCPPTGNLVTDVYAPTSLNYNAVFNISLTLPGTDPCFAAATNEANGATGKWSATPNATGLLQADPAYGDPRRTFVGFDHEYLGNNYPTWVNPASYTAGDFVQLGTGGFYGGRVIGYRALVTHNSSSANSMPGTGTAWHQYWEFSTLYRVRQSIINGTTITDATLGLSGATYNTAIIAWVKQGLAPTNVAFHNTDSTGGDRGAVPYVSSASVPVVSGIVVDDVTYNGGHSCARFTWNSDLTPDNQQVSYCTENGSTCTGGSPTYDKWAITYAPGSGLVGQQEIICGATPGSTVHFCPQSHNGVGWSSCAGLDQVVTFPVVVHSVPALPNVAYQPYPNTSGFATFTLDPTCSNWNSVWATASTHSVGSIIYLPAGQTCTGNFIISPADEGPGGIHPYVFTQVNNPTPGTFAINSHGYTLNQTVQLDADNPSTANGIPAGLAPPPTKYYIVNPTTNTFQLSATPSGSPIVPGNGGFGSQWIAPTTPLSTAKIVLRSNAADSVLPPEGVRLDPVAYGSRLGILRSSNTPTTATVLVQPFSHDLHIGPGIEVTSSPYFAAQSNKFDNPVQRYLWYQYARQGYQSIAFDRTWMHGQPCPDRTTTGFGLDGANIQVGSSVIDNMAACRPNYSGLATSTATNTITIGSGTYWFLNGLTSTVSPTTATLSGSGSGTIYITVPPGSNTPKIYLPAGLAGSCTGCTIVTGSGLTNFPNDAAVCVGPGHLTEGPVAYLSAAGTALGIVTMAVDEQNVNFVCDTPVGGSGEGGYGIDSAVGPGPSIVTNNLFHNDIGINYFIEDTGAALGYPIGNYLTQMNTFTIDDVWSPSNAATNHLNSCHRHEYEDKTGTAMALIGNIFNGQFGWCQPSGMSALLISNNAAFSTSVPPTATASDLTAKYNTFTNGSGGLGATGAPGDGANPHTARRILIQNNLFTGINSWQHTSVPPAPGIYNPTPGWALYLGYSGEDWVIDHNTIYSTSGPNTSGIWFAWSKQEGMVTNNNMFIATGQDATHNIVAVDGLTAFGQQAAVPNCYNKTGIDAMTCSWTPNYQFLGNGLAAGYTNTQTQSGSGSATMSGAYSTANASNVLRTEGTVAARIAAVKWFDSTSNHRLRYDSPYNSAAAVTTDKLDGGADIDALEAAQGKVSNVRAHDVASTSAVIGFLAPDTTGCTVDWTTNGFSTFTRVANAGGARVQNVTLSLSAHTAYQARVNCAAMQPVISFTTQ